MVTATPRGGSFREGLASFVENMDLPDGCSGGSEEGRIYLMHPI